MAKRLRKAEKEASTTNKYTYNFTGSEEGGIKQELLVRLANWEHIVKKYNDTDQVINEMKAFLAFVKG